MTEFEGTPDVPDVSMPGEAKGAPGSGLDQLRGKRRKAVQDLHTDQVVPRSEDLFGTRVIVRYRPCTDAERKRVEKRFGKSKSDEADVQANAVLLATCAMGVFTDHERDDPESWMKFDQDLAALILDSDEEGAKVKTAADVVRLLYVTDGDVAATAAKILEFSGYTFDELEDASTGN